MYRGADGGRSRYPSGVDDYALIEALLWERASGYYLLERHLARLARSAAVLGFVFDVADAARALDDLAEQLPGDAAKVRLTWMRSGRVVAEAAPLRPAGVLRVSLAAAPVDSTEPLLAHKTTRRELYDQALAAHPEADDVVLWNERGEVTETCHGNVVIEVAGRRVTPPVACGLLPGTFRAHLLETGELVEAIVTLAALTEAPRMFMINSVRRLCPLVWAGAPPALESRRAAALQLDEATVRPVRA